MLRLTRTFIVTSIAKSSDKTQGNPIRIAWCDLGLGHEVNKLAARPTR
jgi:hypothetical protein